MGPFTSKTYCSVLGLYVFMPNVDTYLSLLLLETVICDGIYEPVLSVSPSMDMARVESCGAIPPPNALPNLLAAGFI